MSNVRSFRRPDRLRHEQAARDRAELARMLEGFQGSPVAREIVGDLLAVADREIAGRTDSLAFKEFLAMYTRANREVVRYLRKESKFKVIAPDVWAILLDHVRLGSDYEIMIDREVLIAKAEASPRAVGQVLKELCDFQALRRERVPEPGKQGRGRVRYFLNARVASMAASQEARILDFKAAPPLGKTRLPTEGRSRAAVVPAVL